MTSASAEAPARSCARCRRSRPGTSAAPIGRRATSSPPERAMSRLEKIDGGAWRDFLAAPVAVLLLGKTTCPACQAYAQELESFLAQDSQWGHVRFGKMLLDEGGLGEF